MAKAHQCEFFLLRYVPNLVRGEYVNFGIVLLGSGKTGFAEVRWTHNLSRIRCLDAGADLDYLEALEDDLQQKLATAGDRDAMLNTIQESFSNVVQASPLTSLATESPSNEIELLASQYLESPALGRETRYARGRALLRESMRSEFDRAGVLLLMEKNIPVSRFTRSGDPMKIDFGYRNGALKMFHAVSLAGDISAVKPLCFSFAAITARVAEHNQISAELTAVCEDNLDRNSESVAFALYSFEQAHIKVASLAAMPRIAAQVREDLRV